MNINIKIFDPFKRNPKKKITPKKQLQIFLVALAGALLITEGIIFFIIYNEGNIAAKNAEDLLLKYEQNLSQASSEPVTGSADEESPSVTLSPATVPDIEPYEGYMVLGILQIDKIGQQLPVISETTTEALKVSCCYYKGPIPPEEGNLVITGHNYASGAIFGRLSKLSKGDFVVFSTPIKDYSYEVYETKVIMPDDVEALKEYEGDFSLTLMTCTSHGNRRLLVFCKLLIDS